MNLKVNYISRISFDSGTAPIAPIENDDSSFLLFYSDKQDNNLYVQKMSKNGDKIGQKISVNEMGYPYDIISGPLGFFALGGN